jgi:hypothetical protein
VDDEDERVGEKLAGVSARECDDDDAASGDGREKRLASALSSALATYDAANACAGVNFREGFGDGAEEEGEEGEELWGDKGADAERNVLRPTEGD